MKPRQRNALWGAILALLAGFGLGLVYSWVISPVEYVNADPSLLRANFKDQYRAVIAAAYASSGDLERARARLSLLGDPDPMQALNAQAQQMLAAGEPFERVRQVAQLASDLQSGNASLQASLTPPAISTNATPTEAPLWLTNTPFSGAPTLTQSPETPVAIQTPTARPTRTPASTPGAAFALVGQDPLCNADTPEGLLQIMVLDARRRQIPGMEIIVTWNGGEDRFFTGFKPELGNGYADFHMQPDTTYSVRVVEGGTPVSNVIAPPCPGSNGENFNGGLLLTFQQP